MTICDKCKLEHPPIVADTRTGCEQAQALAMSNLLMKIGRANLCCGKTIFWVQHLSGAKAPYEQNGMLHFTTCTGRYARGGKKERNQVG